MTDDESLDLGCIRFTRDGALLRIMLTRPDRRNALTSESTRAASQHLTEMNRDDAIRAILITAEGEHFCAGMDLRRDRSASDTRPRPTAVHRSIDVGPHRLILALSRIEVPVVTAVRGHAAGLGCALALVADFCVTSPTARFSTPFATRGFTPDSGSTWLLPRLVGAARAREMLILGRQIDAATAIDWGLVSRMVPDEELDAHAEALAQELAAGATTSIGLVKWLLDATSTDSFESALRRESLVEDISTRSADFKEGIASFTARRSPEFEGN
ncbi:enoyl-CoA hydratase/isomerase family protein [Microbacterium sp. NPDC055357]